MSPTEGALLQRFPLKKIKVIKKTLGIVLPMIFVLLFLGLMLVIFLGPGIGITATLSILVLIAIISYIYESFYYKNYFYDLTPDGLVIGKGVINTWRITVPRHKVQEVYLDQDLLDRVFGLYDLHLSTATDVSGREAHIDGLGSSDAETLRDILFQWIEASAEKKKAVVYESARPDQAGIIFQMVIAVLLLIIIFLPLVLISPLVLAVMYLDYSVIRYELREDGVFIRTGFFIPKESVYLYRNIQDVADNQDLFSMILGLHTLSVKTMTGASALGARLTYLKNDDAQRIREQILERSRNAALIAVADTSQATTMARKAEVPRTPVKEVEMPFKNDFIRAANYGAGVSFLFFSILGIAIFFFSLFISAPVQGLMVLLICVGFAIVLVIFSYLGAIISQISYHYAMMGDYAQITIQFLSSTKRQIPYGKIQDIEKKVSFANSFAGLADIKLETGSKAFVDKQSTASMAMANEIIPSLKDSDSESLKSMLAKAVGVSLEGLGKSPLVAQLPLSKRKPLKKTLWWVIYSLAILAVMIVLHILFPTSIVSIPLILASVAIIAIVVVLKYIYEIEYYKRYYYDLNEDVLVIKKGVFGSRELTVPLMRIQDVFIDRDLLDLAFGLYDVYISTATARSILNAHIDGLDEKNAEKAALFLVNLIAKK